MSDSHRRRRKRSGSTSARYRPSELIAPDKTKRSRFGKAEIFAAAGVVLVVGALSFLLWVVAGRSVAEQRAEIRTRAEQALAGQAATIAETIAHELLAIDQTLTIIQGAWKTDSDSVDLKAWQKQLPSLMAVADDLFIADDKRIIHQDILPQAVGQGIGSAYLSFPHGSLERFYSDGTKDKQSQILQGDLEAPIDGRLFLMYIVRPLDHPLGWSVGASFRTQELPKLFAGAGLGPNAIGALIDTRRGNAQAVIGPAARRPKTDLSKTVLYSMMQRAESGIWIGPSEIDSIERVNAYRKVAGRDMVVLVGANLATIMEPAENLASATRALAFVANIMMVAVGGLVLWELSNIRSNRRQKRAFDRTRGEVQRLRDEEAANLSRTALASGRLAVLMETTPDGIALFDTEQRLMQWNSPFALGTGIGLRAEMPVDHLVRELAARGVFGPLPDFESAILQRAAILAAGDPNGIVMVGPDGKALQMRGLPVPQGGFMIMLGGAGSWEEMPEAPPLPQQAAVAPQPPPAVAETYRPPVAPVPEPPPAVDW